MANEIKMSPRAVQNRRRTVEIRLGVKLETLVDLRAEHNKKQKEERLARLKEENENRIQQAPINIRRGTDLDKGRIIVFSDAHFYPDDTTTAFKALLKFIEYFKPNIIVNNGDSFDGGSISRFPRIGWDKKPTVQEELEANKFYLGEIEKIRPAGCRLIWCLGNHDARFENRLAANAPPYEQVKGFSLKDHFPAWHPCWSCWPTEEVVVKHRWKGGVHATHNNTVNAGVSIVTGHLHSLKVTPYADYNGNRFGVDTGTLADTDGAQFVNYLEDSPTNWRSGFAVLTFHNGKLLWPELVHKWAEGQVEFRGKVYDV
jgi:hypothetical protein